MPKIFWPRTAPGHLKLHTDIDITLHYTIRTCRCCRRTLFFWRLPGSASSRRRRGLSRQPAVRSPSSPPRLHHCCYSSLRCRPPRPPPSAGGAPGPAVPAVGRRSRSRCPRAGSGRPPRTRQPPPPPGSTVLQWATFPGLTCNILRFLLGISKANRRTLSPTILRFCK